MNNRFKTSTLIGYSMQLDAIGEHHPRPLIQRAFIHTGFGRKAERAAIHGYFRDGNSPTPYFVIEDSFWKFFKQKMLRLGQEHHDRQKESYDPLELSLIHI